MNNNTITEVAEENTDKLAVAQVRFAENSQDLKTKLEQYFLHCKSA